MSNAFDARVLLQEHRAKLAAIAPYPWGPVEAWIAGVRPLIRAHFGVHLEDFEQCSKTPRWYEPAYFAGTSRSGVRLDNFDRANASARQHDSAAAEKARATLLAFIDGLLSLPPPQGAAPQRNALILAPAEVRVQQTYNFHGPVNQAVLDGSRASMSSTTTICESTVGAAAVGPGAAAVGDVSASTTLETDDKE